MRHFLNKNILNFGSIQDPFSKILITRLAKSTELTLDGRTVSIRKRNFRAKNAMTDRWAPEYKNPDRASET